MSSNGVQNVPSSAAGTNPVRNAVRTVTQAVPTTGLNGTPTVAQALATATSTAGLSATPSAPPNTGSPVQPSSGLAASGGSSVATSPGVGVPAVLVNGTAVTPGSPVINVPTAASIRTLVIQNGPGNIALPSAADIRNATTATVIQNTLDGQTIRAVTQMNVSLGLTKAMTASAIQNAVGQGMATAGR
jgi:hypothetical protein